MELAFQRIEELLCRFKFRLIEQNICFKVICFGASEVKSNLPPKPFTYTYDRALC